MVMGAQINGSHGDDGTSLLPLLPKIRRKWVETGRWRPKVTGESKGF
jgi:hypothetical protein